MPRTDHHPAAHADEDALQRLRIVGSRKRAERLRLEAVELSRRYKRLARRQRLDAEVVADDVRAVTDAWQDIVR